MVCYMLACLALCVCRGGSVGVLAPVCPRVLGLVEVVGGWVDCTCCFGRPLDLPLLPCTLNLGLARVQGLP